jgi:hypothetical protein
MKPAAGHFASMLSEVRKFKLGLVLANQFSAQLSDGVRQAVIDNAATRIILGIGSEDAERLKLEIAPYPPRHAEELAPFTGLLKTSGRETEPLDLLPPIDTHRHRHWRTNRAHIIRAESRRRFASARADMVRIAKKTLLHKAETPTASRTQGRYP